MSEIDFEKRREYLSWGRELDIPVGDQADVLCDRLVEREPAAKADARDGNRSVLQRAIHVVDRQLVLNEEVRDEYFVLPPARTTERNPGKLRTFLGKRVQGSLVAKEEAPQQPSTGERQEARIRPGRGAESGDDLCLLTVNDPHDAQLALQLHVARLHHEPSFSLIPSHGVPRSWFA